MIRWACRRDANEPDVEELLHAHGFQTWSLDGAPFDLIVWRRGGRAFLLLECKSRYGSLTPRQRSFFGCTEGLPRFAVKTPDAALQAAKQYC